MRAFEYRVLPAHPDLHPGFAPVRFDCDGRRMAEAGDVARECAADLAEELDIDVHVWLYSPGSDRWDVVDSRLAGNPSHWPYRHDRQS